MQKKMIIIQVGETIESNEELDLVLNKAWNKNIDAQGIKIEKSVSEDHLESIVKDLSKDSNGVIIQLPLPEGINYKRIYDAIPPSKNLVLLAKEKSIDSILEIILNNN